MMNKIVTPKHQPRTLIDLYRHYSGDEYARESEIKAAWELNTTPVRRRIISLALKGYSEHQIARGLSMNRGVVKQQILRACESAGKQIHGIGLRGKVSASKARALALMR